MNYKPLVTQPGQWIKQGTKEDAVQYVGQVIRMHYHDGEYRTVRIVKVHTYGGLLVPEVETVSMSRGLRRIAFGETELIHFNRLQGI